MLLRNRELIYDTLGYAAVSVILVCIGAFHACGGIVFGACVLLWLLHMLASWVRYRRIQRLNEALDALLDSGTPLSIQEYREGELSILANQIQKLTLRLTEAAQLLQQEKLFLADSLADISHQLRTPLTAMNLTAAMLSAPELTEPRRRELTMELKNLLSRTQWLVEALLKISKLDAGTIQLQRERVSVKELAYHAAAPLAVAMDVKNQQLTVSCLNEVFTGDLIWTGEALGNILKNCMEHTPEGGSITVAAEENPLYTQITVDDTGPGFSSEDLPHLFERFYKGSNASQTGYGIGLALARTIVSAQNGTIQAQNTDSGARFIIKFYKQVI